MSSASSGTFTAVWRRSPKTGRTPVRSVRGPHGLRGRGLERTRLLPGGREADQRRSAAACAGRARHSYRTEPHRQPSALAGNTRHRYGRDLAPVLHHARARRGPEDLRKLLRRTADHARVSHRRAAAMNSTRASKASKEILR